LDVGQHGKAFDVFHTPCNDVQSHYLV
jgi:hypothetical protein